MLDKNLKPAKENEKMKYQSELFEKWIKEQERKNKVSASLADKLLMAMINLNNQEMYEYKCSKDECKEGKKIEEKSSGKKFILGSNEKVYY